jgi:hypothetical protein
MMQEYITRNEYEWVSTTIYSYKNEYINDIQ